MNLKDLITNEIISLLQRKDILEGYINRFEDEVNSVEDIEWLHKKELFLQREGIIV